MNFRHKLIIPAANLITGMCGFYLSMYQISVLQISEVFKLSSFMMGVIVAAQFAGFIVPPFVLGTLCERIGKRGVMMIALPLMILGTFLISVTNNIILFIAGVLIIGAGFSVTEGTICAVLATEFGKRSTFHLGIAQASFSLGAVISPLTCEALFAAGFKYNELFGIMSVVFLVLFILFSLTKQEYDVKDGCNTGILGALRFFRRKVFIFISVAMVMYVGAEGVIAFFTDSWFEVTLKAPHLSALALSLFWAGMIPTRLLLGAIKLRPRTTIIGCAAGVLLCILAVIIARSHTVMLIAFAGLGVFCGPCWPLIIDVVAKKYPANAGTASNLMVALGGLGGSLMPVAAGALVAGANFMPVFFVSAACAAVMAAMFFFAGREKTGR